MCVQQQFGEVDEFGMVVVFLVGGVGLVYGFQLGVMWFGLDVLWLMVFVFLFVDLLGDLFGWEFVVVDFQLLYDLFDQVQLVV